MGKNDINKHCLDIYNLPVILENYCMQNAQVEKVDCILSQVELILEKIDILNQTIINTDIL